MQNSTLIPVDRKPTKPSTPIVILCCALTGCLLSWPSQAVSPARTSTWYYRIGGAQAVSAAANIHASSARLGGSLDLSHIYSCGNFNPITGLTSILNNAQGQVMNIYGTMVNALTSVIGSLPALILQRASPGLYDLYQNMVLRGEMVLNLANASCEQMETEIRDGKNPYERFLNVAKGFDWKVQMGNGSLGSASNDVKTAKDTVETNNGKNGVPWLGGTRAGGDHQDPVNAITDTVLAGYNIELGRTVTDTGAAPSGPAASALSKVWASPADAQAYAVFVLGDVEFTTSQSQPRKATPGHGILPKIEVDKAPILAHLQQLVNGSTAATDADLAPVSGPGIAMTREVIEAIRALPTTQEQQAAMQKLADEAATGVNLEKALLLRRLLQSGRMEPNIYASGLGEEIEQGVKQITEAIDNVLYETRIRRELFAQTASVLLAAGQQKTAETSATPRPASNDVKPIEDGEVKP